MSTKIFLSWSGSCAREMAKSLKERINHFFKSATEIYFSPENEPGERGVEQVITALKNADIVIYIFTKESACSEWVLYEFAYARALRDSADKNGTPKLIPLVTPSIDSSLLPKPIRDEGSQLLKFSQDGFKKILSIISESIPNNEIYKEKLSAELENQFHLIDLEFKEHINNYPHDDTIYNTVIDPNHIVHSLNSPQWTKEQQSFYGPSEKNSITLSEIPEIFANYIENIPNRSSCVKSIEITGDLLKTTQKKGYSKHHQVWFNDTRISTFIAISDGQRVILHNRPNDTKQKVKNDNLDCFGAVEFENWTLLMKISGERAHSVKSKSFSHIPVVAYENILVNTLTKPRSYLCMMFGYEFMVSSEDYDLILEENKKPTIRSIRLNDFIKIKDNALTSKAQAYKDFVFSRII